MPTQTDDRSALTPRQVLDQAITGIENLRLLLEETETLAHCACQSLDAIPWSSRARPATNIGREIDTLDDFDTLNISDIIGLSDPSASPSASPAAAGDEDLAVGRMQTLVLAEGRAMQRVLRYCQHLQEYLLHLIERLPNPVPTSSPPTASTPTTPPNPSA